MKKYKLRPINSVSFYYRNRLRKRRLIALLCGMVCITSIFVIVDDKIRIVERIFPRDTSLMKINNQEEISHKYTISYDLYDKPTHTRGIYNPSHKIYNYEEYIELAKETGINTFVIDLKNDHGYFMFSTHNKMLNELGVVTQKKSTVDIKKMMLRLYEEGIYPVARVVAFKDNVMTKKYPERAVKKLDGSIYKISTGEMWLDPYNKDNWEYLVEVCKEAENIGFREVQFDYIRFHESMNKNTILLDGNKSKMEVITEFTKYAYEKIKPFNINISADVFGAVILGDVDASIVGQDFKEMSKYLDYISPMVYPSHYASGTFGIDYPHIDAYGIILNTMKLGKKKIHKPDSDDTNYAKIRPWLQDFTLKYIEPYHKYGPKEIRDQIKATYDAGLTDWLFWNASGNYTVQGFK